MSGLSGLEHHGQRKRGRWAEILWPPVDTLDAARSAARQGFWVSIVMLGVVAVFTGVTLLKMKVIDLLVMLIWAAFLAFVALGIRRMWRFAALFAFLGYAIIAILSLAGGAKSGLIMLLVTLAYGNSVRGTFAHHRLLGRIQAGQVA
jgi:hypothetical protein